MQLWAGHSTHFVRDTTHNQIAEKLRTAFFHHYRYDPPPSEVNAWRNSLRAVATVFQEAALDDHGVMLEYRLPLSSKRLDCLVDEDVLFAAPFRPLLELMEHVADTIRGKPQWVLLDEQLVAFERVLATARGPSTGRCAT